MLKARQSSISSECKRSLLGVLRKKTTLYSLRNKSWKHVVAIRRPSFAGIHTTTVGVGNGKSYGNNDVVLMGMTSIAAVCLLGGIYSYTKSIFAKESSETNSLIADQKADWEAFHLQSLQYDEEDDEEEVEEDLDFLADNDKDDDEIVSFIEDKISEIDNHEELEEEEDEPTTCSICLINRQGPCRFSWKKFERCIKQQIPSSSSSSSSSSQDDKKVCDPFFLPWLECFSQHRITYSMLTNQSIRPEFDFLEETHGTQTPFPSYLVPVWPSKINVTTISTTHDDNGDHKILNEQHEEEMLLHDVMTSTTYQRKILNIPLINRTTGNTIYVAYVRDEQQGNILGFDYFSTELEQLQQQQQDTNDQLAEPNVEALEEEGDDEVTKPNQKTFMIPPTTTGQLMFHVPVGTTSVVVHALYKTKIGNENEIADKEEREQNAHSMAKQQQKDMQTTEDKASSEKVYVQIVTLENSN